jgi:hypothetical protein
MGPRMLKPTIHSFIHPLVHPASSNLSLSFMADHQNPVCISHLLHICHMPHPAHPPSFYPLNNICWAVQIMKIFIIPFSPYNQTSSSSPCSTTPSSYVISSMSRPSFTPIRGKIIILYSLIFMFLCLYKWEDMLYVRMGGCCTELC